MISTRLRAFYNPFIGFLPQLGLAALLLVGGRMVVNGSLTLGEFVSFYGYLLMLLAPVRTLGWTLGLAQRATASGARLFELLDREARIVAAPDADAAAGGLGPRRAARRHARLRRRSRQPRGARAARCLADRRGRHDARARRGDRIGQDDARPAHPAPVRPDRRRGARRRRRRAQRRPARAARADRGRQRRPVSVQRDGAREHRLRALGGQPRGGRRGRSPRAGARLHHAAARRLRHARGRARD